MPIVGHTFVADDGRIWDLETMVRTDPDGTQHPESEWTDAERAAARNWVLRITLGEIYSDIRVLVGSVELITARTLEDIEDAQNRQIQIGQWEDSTTALAATIRGIPSPTVAQIKEQLALACERDVRVAQEFVTWFAWRQTVDELLGLLARCLGGLTRLVTEEVDGV